MGEISVGRSGEDGGDRGEEDGGDRGEEGGGISSSSSGCGGEMVGWRTLNGGTSSWVSLS